MKAVTISSLLSFYLLILLGFGIVVVVVNANNRPKQRPQKQRSQIIPPPRNLVQGGGRRGGRAGGNHGPGGGVDPRGLYLYAKVSSSRDGKDILSNDPDKAPILEYFSNTNDYKKSKSKRIIEFYSPWCGACQQYAPRYIQTARHITSLISSDKNNGIEFYAVSCMAHVELCRENNIDSYPTLIAYDNNSNKKILINNEKFKSYNKDIVENYVMNDLFHINNINTDTNKNTKVIDYNTSQVKKKKKSLRKLEEEDDDDDDNNKNDGNDVVEEDEGEEQSNNNILHNTGAEIEEEPEDDEEEEGNGKDKDDDDDDDDDNVDSDAENKFDNIPEDLARKSYEERRNSLKFNQQQQQQNQQNQYRRPQFLPSSSSQEQQQEQNTNLMIGPDIPSRPGAARARLAGTSPNMDKWMHDIMRKKNELAKKKRHGRNFFNNNRRGDRNNNNNNAGGHRGKWQQRNSNNNNNNNGGGGRQQQQQESSAMTETMKKFQPGTIEYQNRRQKILDALQKQQKRNFRFRGGTKPNILNTAQVFERNKNLVNEVERHLPMTYVKEISKPKLIEKVPIVKQLVANKIMLHDEELYLDASLSFINSIKYYTGTMTNEKKHVLKKWLQLLSISLPPEWALHNMISDLYDNIDDIFDVEESEKDRNKDLSSFLQKHKINRNNYSNSCTNNKNKNNNNNNNKDKDKKGSRDGYTCGLWKLLHIITIGVAENKGGSNLIEGGILPSDDDDNNIHIFSPDDAAETIKNFIENFFQCDECRTNFINKYDDCSFRRCDRLTTDELSSDPDDWKQLSLWLWEVHNDVSVSIVNKKIDDATQIISNTKDKKQRRKAKKKIKKQHKDISTYEFIRKEADPIKYLWPSIGSCLSCFNDDGSWNEDEVFIYLEKEYWYGTDDEKTNRLLKKQESGSNSSLWIMLFVALGIFFVLRKHITNRSTNFQMKFDAVTSSLINRGKGAEKRAD